MEIQPDSSGNAVQFGLGYWVGGIILDVPVDTTADSIVALAKASLTAPRYVLFFFVSKKYIKKKKKIFLFRFLFPLVFFFYFFFLFNTVHLTFIYFLCDCYIFFF